MAKSSKQEIGEKVETERFTRNRFIPLAVTPTDAVETDGTIPVLANGVITLKGREKKTNISISPPQKKILNTENPTTKRLMKKLT